MSCGPSTMAARPPRLRRRIPVRVGRIPYVNCYPVYGAIDRGIVPLAAELVDGVPTALNKQMAAGTLDVSVVSAVEYARNAGRYLLLPDLAISCDGPVRSVALFSKRPADQLDGRRVVVSRSSMTSVALLDAGRGAAGAPLLLPAGRAAAPTPPYAHVYDLGAEWKAWTELPFVFAV